eukprot:scaffold1756_cov117-Isochrysis_galbana.AAC.16
MSLHNGAHLARRCRSKSAVPSKRGLVWGQRGGVLAFGIGRQVVPYWAKTSCEESKKSWAKSTKSQLVGAAGGVSFIQARAQASFLLVLACSLRPAAAFVCLCRQERPKRSKARKRNRRKH